MTRAHGRIQREPRHRFRLLVTMLFLPVATGCSAPLAEPEAGGGATRLADSRIQLGPRPFYLLDRLSQGPLRSKLESCRAGPFRPSHFSIGHRGAPLQFPEHTRESYVAAARMGAGTIECDVTFTRDHELVCRHSQCDLHRTTNILETPLAAKCSQEFSPAEIDDVTSAIVKPAAARCCTSDLTLAEFRRLEGRMDAANPAATTVTEYLDATPRWRTDLYANGGTLMTHAESIALLLELGVTMAPELKAPMVEMPFEGLLPAEPQSRDQPSAAGTSRNGYTRDDYARDLVAAYREAGVPPERVRMQSFDRQDIRRWFQLAPGYAAQAIWLDDRDMDSPTPLQSEFDGLAREGLRTIAPPIALLLRLDQNGELRASEYARRARAAGLDLITWTAERSGRLRAGRVEGRTHDFYYEPILTGLQDDGDIFRILHALASEVGVRGIFSDWPATTTYYANCFELD
ncbi:MAG: glycerophosphodiester phosphodiesterase [Deltaproteobacteria bacterium]|nr:glycerophosphodiester phosphodiesterase [Deltaproteobacteria bacterium]